MSNLVDVVQSIINQISLDVEINNVVDDKLYVCSSTAHLTITKIVQINGLDYTIVDFEFNNWIQVTPFGHSTPVPIDTKVVIAPSITFLHGDPYSTNAEYLQLSTQTLEKTPIIWLLESYNFQDLPRDSSIDLSFDARLFFLDWYSQRYLNKDHNNNAIKPMQNLQKAFIDVINNDFNFKTLETVSTVVRPRFGVQVKSEGNEPQPKQKIIDEDLSGIDSKMKIEVYDVSSCSCN